MRIKHARNSLAWVVAIVLTVVLSFGWATSSPEPAQAQGAGCIVEVTGTMGLVVCAGEGVGQVSLPTVTVQGPKVTLPPVTVEVPGPTIKIPGPTQTVTVRPPPVIKTVRVPGERVTQTETVRLPGETKTVRLPGETKTVTETAKPSEQPTATVTATPSESAVPDDDRVVPVVDREPGAVDLGDGKTTIVEVGLGTLAILSIIGLIILAMYLGYVIGWKDKERKDTNFMRAVLEQSALRRGKHS